LRSDTTTTALNFVSKFGDEARKAMLTITIASYVKGTAMPCMNLLVDCRNLKKINISTTTACCPPYINMLLGDGYAKWMILLLC
jgi:hypothetical protein